MRWLTPDELYRLTGRKRYKAQCRELARRGVRFTAAASGEPLVLIDSVDAKGKPAHRGPQWDRIGSVRNLRP